MKEKKGNNLEIDGLREGEDYYFDRMGRCVFTRKYLVSRGYCCKSGCKHCPYGYKKSSLL